MNDINVTILKDKEGSICMEGYIDKDCVMNINAIHYQVFNHINTSFSPERIQYHRRLHLCAAIDKLFSLLVTNMSEFIENHCVINITIDKSVNEYFHSFASAIIDGYNENAVMKYTRFSGETAERIERESKIIADKIKTDILNIPTNNCNESKTPKNIIYPIPSEDAKYDYITIYNNGTDIYYCDGYMSYPVYEKHDDLVLSINTNIFWKIKILIDFITSKVSAGGHIDLVRGIMSISSSSTDFDFIYLLEYILRKLNYDVKVVEPGKSDLLKQRTVYIHLSLDAVSLIINTFNASEDMVSFRFNDATKIMSPLIDVLKDKDGKIENTNVVVYNSSSMYFLENLRKELQYHSNTNTVVEGSIETFVV